MNGLPKRSKFKFSQQLTDFTVLSFEAFPTVAEATIVTFAVSVTVMDFTMIVRCFTFYSLPADRTITLSMGVFPMSAA